MGSIPDPSISGATQMLKFTQALGILSRTAPPGLLYSPFTEVWGHCGGGSERKLGGREPAQVLQGGEGLWREPHVTLRCATVLCSKLHSCNRNSDACKLPALKITQGDSASLCHLGGKCEGLLLCALSYHVFAKERPGRRSIAFTPPM